MSLSVALQVAQSALAARQTEMSTVSRNVAGAQEAGYSRKSVMLSTLVTDSGQSGGVRVDGVGRVTDNALYASLLRSSAVGMSQEAVLEGLEKLASTFGDTELEMSPAAMLGDLKTALQNAAADPNDTILAQDLLTTAKDMVAVLNQSSETAQTVRADADAAMSDAVDHVNQLLGQLEGLNTVIVRGNQSGNDVTDALDSRDQVLLALSEEMGITTLTRTDGDVVVYTDGGVTLFETTAREVRFEPTNTYSATTTGNSVYVDGVPVAGDNAIMPLSSGRIYGLTQLRDDIAPQYQSQLDEIARGLVESFAESDQSGGGGPDQAGLFTWSGAPGVPVTATLSSGLAADIRINANADPDQGGELDLLRDGGISDPLDPDYDYNPGDLAGYTGRYQDFLDALDEPRVFDAGVGLDPTDSLTGFASSSVSWLESTRKTATSDLEVQSVIVSRTAESLANTTGVNIDEEMTLLLDIERAYAAASKLISAVDSMLDDLLAVAR